MQKMLALVNGKIITMAGRFYERGTVVVKERIIAALGPDLDPPPAPR